MKERVAIKELAEGTSPEQQRELVEEARVLASVQNYYCVKCARSAYPTPFTQQLRHER